MNRLKRRLQLKRVEIQIEEEVSWNFGYDPNTLWFNVLLEQRNELSSIVRESDPEWWEIYERFRMEDSCKNLMVFTQ